MKRVLLVFGLMLLLALPATAQDDMMASPSVMVSDQVSLDGTVTVDSAYSEGPGWIVIHVDNGEGAPGPVAGYAALNAGWNYNIAVPVDTTMVTPTLFAMLHVDAGTVGEYEFPGDDGPVVMDGAPITPPFAVDLIHARDQFVDMNTVAIHVVVAQNPGWLVVHADSGEGSPGPVLGYAAVEAGNNMDVMVTLEGDITPVLWPMLHVDAGTAGEYEFPGDDGPVAANGRVAVTAINNQNAVRMSDQIVLHGDSMAMDMMEMSVTAASVLSETDGWLVVHADNGEGAPGPVLGYAAVAAGFNADVVVTLEGDVTPVLFPMLHVDASVAGEYEFPGDDGPATDAAGNVVVFPINAAPSIDFEGSLDGDVITVAQALIDAPGWLVIHANNEGAPGAVIGYAPLRPGINSNVAVTVDAAAAGDMVFPMLHYDTGEAGVYEFPDADPPVAVNESVVVGPLDLSMGE